MTTSDSITEIAAAAAKAQADLQHAKKQSLNPAFRSKYADLASVLDAAKVYARHGIAVFQDIQSCETGVSVWTRLAHSSGQWMEFGPFVVPVAKRDAHGMASAATYAKRHAATAALLIAADEDDDGNEAVTSIDLAAKPDALISDDQLRHLQQLARAKQRDAGEILGFLSTLGYQSSREIRRRDYERVCAAVERGQFGQVSA